MNNSLIVKSLPLIASVLGQKYGVQVMIGGSAASTNGDVIRLPDLPLECDDTLTGLARGFIDHEAAHIRDTDFRWLEMANLTPLEMHIFNILEDWRVEHKLSSQFPGCRQNFNWLIKHLFENEKLGDSLDPAAEVLNWILVHVRSWDVSSLSKLEMQGRVLAEMLYPGLTENVLKVLRRVQKQCASTKQAILYARQIHSLLLAEAEKNPPGKDRKVKSIEDLPEVSDSLQKLIQGNEYDMPPSIGGILVSELEKARPTDCVRTLQVAEVVNKEMEPLHEIDIKETKQSVSALRARLQGLLQTVSVQRSRIGRSGKLDALNLHRLSVSDGRIFRGRGERIMLDTAVHILMDVSASMRRRMTLATLSCYAVAKSLEDIQGINVGVTVFPSKSFHEEDGVYHRGSVCPVVYHGDSVHNRFLMKAGGSTPMGEALWWVLQRMIHLSESRKIILILSDGKPDSFMSAVKAIEAGRQAGVELYGIGIANESIQTLLPNKSVVINDLSELAPAMFGLLSRVLTIKEN
ncbi:MAG: VWA domain-containing protein [Desulfovibrio sp.]